MRYVFTMHTHKQCMQTQLMYLLVQLLVTDMLKRYPVQCEELFLTREPKKLTAPQIYDLFSPIYSPQGSNAWEKELQVMVYWMNFLEDCEGTFTAYTGDCRNSMCIWHQYM